MYHFYFDTIRKEYPAPMILNSGFIGDQFSFDPTGPTGHLVIIEASSELLNWQPIWTNAFSPDLNFSDQQSGVYSDRFYRTHQP